jgi:hypothetical protein
MNKIEKTIIDNLEDFLANAYSALNHDPNHVFEKNDRGHDVFTWEDDLFSIKVDFIGIEHIVELHVVYFKSGNGIPKPVWSLSLQSTVFMKSQFSMVQDFRKSINHMHKYNGETLPIKGPKSSTIGMYKYDHVFVKDWKDFKNRSEVILINEKKAFESRYEGGLMMSVQSLNEIWDEYVSKYKRIHKLPEDDEDLFQGYTYVPFSFSWPA